MGIVMGFAWIDIITWQFCVFCDLFWGWRVYVTLSKVFQKGHIESPSRIYITEKMQSAPGMCWDQGDFFSTSNGKSEVRKKCHSGSIQDISTVVSLLRRGM